MADALLVKDLVRKKEVVDTDLEAAARPYLERESPGPIALGEIYVVDVAAAIEAHKPSREVLADPKAPAGLRRTMVLTAIVMGTAQEA